MGDFLKRNNFFTDETKKLVLTCLRLETRSNIHYFWSFTMHSLSSSKLLFWPSCNYTPFYPKRARYSVPISDLSRRDILKRSNFFKDETKKLVQTCLRLETRSNIHYWSFIMHSVSSSNFFLRPWCTSTPIYSKRERYSVHLKGSSMRDFLKRSNSFTDETKIGFNLCTLRNRFQHFLLLKFHHPLIIFIKFLFAALVHFYSVSL